MIGRNADSSAAAPTVDAAELEKQFVKALDWFEGTALTRYADGPYLLGADFSLLDIMVISSMERIAAGVVCCEDGASYAIWQRLCINCHQCCTLMNDWNHSMLGEQWAC